jgi:putative endonuclease
MSHRRVGVNAWVYIVRCSDGSYYVGSARGDLSQRIADHNAGRYTGYTRERLPVVLVFSQDCNRITDAIALERKLQGWSRAKKEALIRGDFAELSALSRNSTLRQAQGEDTNPPHAELVEASALRQAQGEDKKPHAELVEA